MPMTVVMTKEPAKEFERLPTTIKVRVLDIFVRLQAWPDVSGAKPLRHGLAGHYRLRTGDWRVMFRVVAPNVIVVSIEHRSRVYED
jgi:mRNA-degrading endonuclease RelE of RelBE toxin-antitoxin system